ncbi:unnamed protein product [Scytosiphon promiscuus]
MGTFRALVGLLALVGAKEAFSFVPGGQLKLSGPSKSVHRLSRASARCSGIRTLSASAPDGAAEDKRVRFAAGLDEEGGEETEGEKKKAKLQTVNARLLAQIEEQGKGIVIETEESKKIKRKEEDLNGVNPFYAILGAGGAAAMSFGSWKATLWLADVYYSKPVEESDILAVARLTSFIKQARMTDKGEVGSWTSAAFIAAVGGSCLADHASSGECANVDTGHGGHPTVALCLPHCVSRGACVRHCALSKQFRVREARGSYEDPPDDNQAAFFGGTREKRRFEYLQC